MNRGGFIPRNIQNVLNSDAPEIYRNPFIAQAMGNLKMVDTIGGGIEKMFSNNKGFDDTYYCDLVLKVLTA